MNRLCIFIGMSVLSGIGWWAGSKIGFMTGFVLAGTGSIVGVYVGWKINKEYFE